jgi:hypothetical protein
VCIHALARRARSPDRCHVLHDSRFVVGKHHGNETGRFLERRFEIGHDPTARRR